MNPLLRLTLSSDSISHLALSLKLPSIILSGKAVKSRGIISWRDDVKAKKTGGKQKHLSAHLSVLKGASGTRK